MIHFSTAVAVAVEAAGDVEGDSGVEEGEVEDEAATEEVATAATIRIIKVSKYPPESWNRTPKKYTCHIPLEGRKYVFQSMSQEGGKRYFLFLF